MALGRRVFLGIVQVHEEVRLLGLLARSTDLRHLLEVEVGLRETHSSGHFDTSRLFRKCLVTDRVSWGPTSRIGEEKVEGCR